MKWIFLWNGYTNRDIEQILTQKHEKKKIHQGREEVEINKVAILPYCSLVTNRSRILAKRNIKIIF